MSPRREDYNQPIVVPKVGSARSPRHRSFISLESDPKEKGVRSSEYRMCFANYHPKRPYVYHAQPSHVFDYVPKPITPKLSSRLSASMTSLTDTEYQERFPNYRSFIPGRELMPAHIPPQPNVLSEIQLKRQRMDKSQYFHHLVSDDDRLHGGQRYFGNSEQRSAYQWPNSSHSFVESPYTTHIQQELPVQVYPAYYVPRNIYEPMPTVSRTTVH